MSHPRVRALYLFTDSPPPDIYTLSLHDALPIYPPRDRAGGAARAGGGGHRRFRQSHEGSRVRSDAGSFRSEEHTSELQSHVNLVCRLLLEKKKRVANVATEVTVISTPSCRSAKA